LGSRESDKVRIMLAVSVGAAGAGIGPDGKAANRARKIGISRGGANSHQVV
jgi:hypothetical protein